MKMSKSMTLAFFLALLLGSSLAVVKFDHSNCMEMRPQISPVRPRGNSLVLAYARIYSIHISSSSFKAGIPIHIVIKSCKAPDGHFHGMKSFLLQARSLGKSFRPIGHFNTSSLPKAAQAISCYYPYDSVVNKLNTNVKELSATWIPPRDYRGTIAFYLTVIPHGTQGYYLRVKSPRLHSGNGTSVALEQKCYSSKANNMAASGALLVFIASVLQLTLLS